MIAQPKFFAAAAFTAALLTACGGAGGGARDRIVSACLDAPDQNNTREQCVCLADQLAANLEDDELVFLAEAMSASEEDRASIEVELANDQALAMSLIGAAKECSLSNDG